MPTHTETDLRSSLLLKTDALTTASTWLTLVLGTLKSCSGNQGATRLKLGSNSQSIMYARHVEELLRESRNNTSKTWQQLLIDHVSKMRVLSDFDKDGQSNNG